MSRVDVNKLVNDCVQNWKDSGRSEEYGVILEQVQTLVTSRNFDHEAIEGILVCFLSNGFVQRLTLSTKDTYQFNFNRVVYAISTHIHLGN